MQRWQYWFFYGAVVVVLGSSSWMLFAQTERGTSKAGAHGLNPDKIAAAAGAKATVAADGIVRVG